MTGVYISYPFCAQKCTFCNFASDVFSAKLRARYEAALLDDLRSHRWNCVPDTVYLGGGTPSLMEPEFLAELMGSIPGEHLTEATLECAPGTVSRERAEAWKKCGINRVSLGVQSFVQGELRQTGRRHTAEIIEHEIDVLQATGISNINIDLIAGLPFQTNESWETSLDWIERLHPPHVSIYLFEIDEESKLGNEVLHGGMRYGASQMPGDDASAEMYERAVERLTGIGLHRYEISNFARRDCESRHNLKYWRLEPYVGFGLDAHSFDGKQRWSTPDSLDRFLSQERVLNCTPVDAVEERFFIGLRLIEGVEPSTSEWDRFAKPIDKWLRTGILKRDGPRLRLSDRGVLISNEVFQDFIDA